MTYTKQEETKRDKMTLAYWEQVYATTFSDAERQRAALKIKLYQEKLNESNV